MTSYLRTQSVALIGGAGFIGHHLALGLAPFAGAVHVLDALHLNHVGERELQAPSNERTADLASLRQRLALLKAAGISLHQVDARDADRLRAALDQTQADVVVHLAGVAHAGRSNVEPLLSFEHGALTLANALEWSRGRVTRFLYFSSSMVYGDFQAASVGEDAPLRPIGVYGALKRAGEDLIRCHRRVFGTPYTIIRPSALYGPRCVSRRVTQVFLERALAGKTLLIEGAGQERLDFTFVDDLVEGVKRAIERENGVDETFNLTCGNARSLNELAEIVAKLFPGVQTERCPRARFRPVRGTLRIDKARRMLGFSPQTQLEAGIESCLLDTAGGNWEQASRRDESLC